MTKRNADDKAEHSEPLRQPTLRHVAELAGVSTAAVSLALRNKPGVSEETRLAVLAAAEDIGYVVNVSARNLRRQRNHTIGLHLPEDTGSLGYYMEFTTGVAEYASSAHEVATLLMPRQGGVQSSLANVDGVVVIDPTSGSPAVAQILAGSRPVVTAERVPPGLPEPTGVVYVDHLARMHDLLSHVTERGARQIAVLLPPSDNSWGIEAHQASRLFGYTSGLSVQLIEVPFLSGQGSVIDACKQLDDGVDAVIAVPDSSAAAAASYLRSRGREVGVDVLLAAYIDGPFAQLLDPPVTALDLRPREFGAACAEMLLGILTSETRSPQVREHKTEFHIRASTTALD
ncbi:MAG: LacI family DNA-binding transcriptional regulator [Gulosibacter sp.]|uniref:LacI family DNA-binding transcriptional regulator n=1 Tax=Gulosibacter sp. TaxID=2817531 RepID=UPI003F8E928B